MTNTTVTYFALPKAPDVWPDVIRTNARVFCYIRFTYLYLSHMIRPIISEFVVTNKTVICLLQAEGMSVWN